MKEAEEWLRLPISYHAKKSWAQTLAINKKKGIFKLEVWEAATSSENWQTDIRSLLCQSHFTCTLGEQDWIQIVLFGPHPARVEASLIFISNCNFLQQTWLPQRENSDAIPLLLARQLPSLPPCPDYMQESTTLYEPWQYLLTGYFVPPSHQVFFPSKELPLFQAFWPI